LKLRVFFTAEMWRGSNSTCTKSVLKNRTGGTGVIGGGCCEPQRKFMGAYAERFG
jgi:hypothetical protein